ncbi:unnamed protein product [Effrenium voratum]|nr:unnamed protein product [Effrenium voratum]
MTDDDLKQPDLTSQKSPGGHTRQHVLAHAHTHERTCTRVPALPLKLALPGGKWPGLAQQNLRRYCSAASLEQVRKFRLKGRRKSQRSLQIDVAHVAAPACFAFTIGACLIGVFKLV